MKPLLHLIGYYFNALSLIAPTWSAKQAFYLFCYPFKAKLRPSQQNFLNASQSFSLKIVGKKVQYYKWGKGQEKILFVHGWQSNSYRWKAFIEAFDKNNYTLYAFDAPGHGNSESKIGNLPLYEKSIATLIDTHGDMDHFVGHSIGSFACASFMYHHNYAVKSYVSLAAPFAASEFFKHFYNRLTLTERSQKNISAFFKTYTTHAIEHYSFDVFSNRIKPDRTLIIHDKEDESTPQKNSIRLFNLMKKANRNVGLTLTEGLKHSLRSKEVVDVVVAFVNGDNSGDVKLNEASFQRISNATRSLK